MKIPSSRSAILYFNPPGHVDTLLDLIKTVVKNLRLAKFNIYSNIRLDDAHEISEKSLHDAEFAITFGGDGTVLSFFHSSFPSYPTHGFNKLGFARLYVIDHG